MADFRNAGIDRGNIEQEIKHLLISASIRREEYLNIIDELEPEELKSDLIEYKKIIEDEIGPLLAKIEKENPVKVKEMALRAKSAYEDIIAMIEERLRE